MPNYRWLLFDADNTLFDFDAAEEFALTRTLFQFGVSALPPVKELYFTINRALWAACDRGEISDQVLVVERFARFLEKLGLEGDPEAWNRFYLDRLSESPTLLPGAETLCRKLSAGYILALVTNGVPYVQRRRLAASPLARFFGERVFISGEMGCRKPERVYFDTVLEALGATRHKGQVLVIGDSLSSDIRGAFNARLDSAWFNRRGAAPGPIHPTYEITGFPDLEKLLLPDLVWRGRGPFILNEE